MTLTARKEALHVRVRSRERDEWLELRCGPAHEGSCGLRLSVGPLELTLPPASLLRTVLQMAKGDAVTTRFVGRARLDGRSVPVALVVDCGAEPPLLSLALAPSDDAPRSEALPAEALEIDHDIQHALLALLSDVAAPPVPG